MRFCWKTFLAVLLVATVAWPKSKNLIINGSWRDNPEPSTLPNLSRHAAVDCWAAPAGKGSVAGWTISPPVVLWYPKRGVRLVSLLGKGLFIVRYCDSCIRDGSGWCCGYGCEVVGVDGRKDMASGHQ